MDHIAPFVEHQPYVAQLIGQVVLPLPIAAYLDQLSFGGADAHGQVSAVLLETAFVDGEAAIVAQAALLPPV